jgi:hypothetical protein
MPDTPPPAAQPDSASEPGELNLETAPPARPRIKRRSLKAKAPGLQPANAPAAARELEQEAPPLSADQATRAALPVPDGRPTARIVTAPPPRTTPAAPPRTTPAVSAAMPAQASRPATTSASGAGVAASKPVSTGPSGQKVNIALTAPQKASVTSPSTSPHGTRPATLYYSTPRKEATPSMKPHTNASPSPATSTSSAGSSASAARPATSAATAAAANPSATRPAASAPAAASRPAATNFDYRTNVERQSREQKSVGNILAYFVYGLAILFLLTACLAGYGAYTINKQLRDESTSISGLDDKYAAKVAELNKEIATTQDTLIQAQATIGRQQELLNKQEEEIGQLRTAINAASSASAEAIQHEAHARAQDTAALRARVRDLENKTTFQHY